MKSIWKTLIELFEVMPRGAKPFYIWYSIVTGALAILDTAALGLIVLTVTPLVSGDPVVLPLLGEMPQNATVWIAITVCGLFILKGVLAVALHWYATRRFARYELEVGDQLFARFMRSSWEKRSEVSTAEITRIVDSSMSAANLSFILPLSQIPSNALTFVSVLLVLVSAQPVTALIAFVYLSLVSLVMVLVVARRARVAGEHNRSFTYRTARIMTEMVEALKEVTLRNKLGEAQEVVSESRRRATRARANVSFLNVVPKYAFEAALIGGFLLVGGAAAMMGGTAQAVAAVTLFAATGFRMIPAMNAVQTSLTSASAAEVFVKDVIRGLKADEALDSEVVQIVDHEELPDDPQVLELSHVRFQYPGSETEVLKDVSLRVPLGSSLAIVGPSGAGKSTLIDVLLGLSVPTAGEMSIDGHPLEAVMGQWRKRVGYVPQQVSLFDASIAQNVALTWRDEYDQNRVEEALRMAHLSELITRGEGVNELVGERGSAISGGQQQRLGIARALYSRPLVIVMDEATSSLDTATENRITESLRELQGRVTFITVAHRLATIRDYDQVCYLDEGRILGSGTFAEVVEAVPDFKLQAQLAGLA